MPTIVVGTGLAIVVIRRLAQEIALDNERGRFFAFASVSLFFWAVWQICSLIAVRHAGGPSSSVVSTLHLLAIVLAFAALASAHAALGDPAAPWTWKHARVVGAVYLVLALLFVLIFVVPLTSDQIVDVLRAWGDGPWPKVVMGIAAALLLGAICRAATYRALAPANPDAKFKPKHALGRTVVLLVLAAVTIAALVAHAWLGAGAAFVALLVTAGTDWAPPLSAAPEGTSQEALARQLSGTLSVVPLALAFGGLVTATVDSRLLPASTDPASTWLLMLTIAVGVLFGLVAGFAHRGRDMHLPPWVFGPLAFTLTLLSWVALPGQLERVFVVLLLALAVVTALRLLGDSGEAELWIGTGAVFAVIPAVYVKPVSAPRGFGAFAVAMFGAIALLLALHVLSSVSARRAPKRRASWIPERVPLFTLLALWLALAFSWPADTFHQARTVAGPADRGTLTQAVGDWLDANTKSGDTYVPMLLVGASGGGSKAAYWTDLVLDCIFGEHVPSAGEGNECPSTPDAADRSKRLFLTSSVSGGSVGIYHFVSRHNLVDSGQPWVDAAAGTEVLSPVTAWGIFHDAPLFMVRAQTDPKKCSGTWSCRLQADRALVQEAAVEGFPHGITPPKHEQQLSETTRLPVTVFNAARNGADARVLLSPFQLASARAHPDCAAPPREGPVTGALDGEDVLGRSDLPLVTAALVSARFPVVAPAARLGRADENPAKHRCGETGALQPIRARDGGYIENTGMLTLSELMPAIQDAIRIWKIDHPGYAGLHVQLIAVSVDDDPEVLAGNPQIKETRGPAFGIATRAGPAYLSEYARDRLTSCQYPDVTYERISPPPHIGAHAATGWELSHAAREHDLGDALKSPEVYKALERVRHWLDGRRSTQCDP